jgi:hypothetical protein
MKAAENLKLGWLIGTDDSGKVYQMRDWTDMIGVCGMDCKKGEEVKVLSDYDSVMEALMRDAADRQ